MILNFSLGQGRLTGKAPVDRFFTSNQTAVLSKFSAFPGDGGFVAIVHGQVRIIPDSHHAQALEFFALNVDKLLGIGPAQSTNLGHAEIFLFFAEFFVHIMLDGQAVAIPARHVDGIVPCHLSGPDNDVFQYFIERRSDVNIPIGIRGSVVKNKLLPSFGTFSYLFVKAGIIPGFQLFRFPFYQAGFHRKFG